MSTVLKIPNMLISYIARKCINETVAVGNSIENTFKKLSAEYELSDCEKTNIKQYLFDKYSYTIFEG